MKKLSLTIVLVSLFITSCATDTSSDYIYKAPENLNDGLDVGTLDEGNIDSALLGKAIDRIRAGKYGQVHSVLIFRDNKLVFEEYFPGYAFKGDGPNYHGAWINWDHNSRYIIMSAGKSITSACIGIAIEEGFIESVEQSIFDYLPDHLHHATGGKEQITIEHLLTMTSGLEWDEWGAPYTTTKNDLIRIMDECDDQIDCVLAAPLVSEPGMDYTYTGGGMSVLGEIIKNATGMDIEAFSNEYMFAPLGIDPVEWRRFDSGIIYAGGEQRMSSRDMVKFGATFLNDGVWKGQQIVSEEWVDKSATPYPGPDNSWLNHFLRPIPPSDGTWGQRGYSYSWWTHEFSDSGTKIHAYYASGWGGQAIIVLPEKQAVAVFTGGNYATMSPVIKILSRYVIPALD